MPIVFSRPHPVALWSELSEAARIVEERKIPLSQRCYQIEQDSNRKPIGCSPIGAVYLRTFVHPCDDPYTITQYTMKVLGIDYSDVTMLSDGFFGIYRHRRNPWEESLYVIGVLLTDRVPRKYRVKRS